MESVGLSMTRFAFPCTITSVFERKITKHLGGAGPQALFSTDSAGWYIQIDGHLAICVGAEEPKIQPGQKFTLKLEPTES